MNLLIPGPPVAKSRPRFARAGSFVRTYTDGKVVQYENLVAICAQEAMQGDSTEYPLDGPLTLFVTCYMKSPKKKRSMPIVKPDLDNMVKAIMDGLSKAGVWNDDAQVTSIHARKVYGTPRAEVRVEPEMM